MRVCDAFSLLLGSSSLCRSVCVFVLSSQLVSLFFFHQWQFFHHARVGSRRAQWTTEEQQRHRTTHTPKLHPTTQCSISIETGENGKRYTLAVLSNHPTTPVPSSIRRSEKPFDRIEISLSRSTQPFKGVSKHAERVKGYRQDYIA